MLRVQFKTLLLLLRLLLRLLPPPFRLLLLLCVSIKTQRYHPCRHQGQQQAYGSAACSCRGLQRDHVRSWTVNSRVCHRRSSQWRSISSILVQKSDKSQFHQI
jgi:hypothetical protein